MGHYKVITSTGEKHGPFDDIRSALQDLGRGEDCDIGLVQVKYACGWRIESKDPNGIKDTNDCQVVIYDDQNRIAETCVGWYVAEDVVIDLISKTGISGELVCDGMGETLRVYNDKSRIEWKEVRQ